jgi:hypothetical protein
LLKESDCPLASLIDRKLPVECVAQFAQEWILAARG